MIGLSIGGGLYEPLVDADIMALPAYRLEVVPLDWRVLIVSNNKIEMRSTIAYRLGLFVYSILQSRNFPNGVKCELRKRAELMSQGAELFYRFVRERDALVICPDQSVDFTNNSTITRSKKGIESVFDAGINAVERLLKLDDKRLRGFIERSDQMKKIMQ